MCRRGYPAVADNDSARSAPEPAAAFGLTAASFLASGDLGRPSSRAASMGLVQSCSSNYGGHPVGGGSGGLGSFTRQASPLSLMSTASRAGPYPSSQPQSPPGKERGASGRVGREYPEGTGRSSAGALSASSAVAAAVSRRTCTTWIRSSNSLLHYVRS